MPADLRRVLVAGGSGFLGSHLVRALVGRGADVHVPTTAAAGTPWRLAEVPGGVVVHHGADVARDADALVGNVTPDGVVNLAAHGVVASQRSSARMVEVNVAGAAALAEATLRHGSGTFVHVGTGLEHGPAPMVDETTPLAPASRYGASKAAASVVLRQLARHEGLPLAIVRPFAAYGPAEDVAKLVPHVATTALRGEPVHLTHGEQIRQYLYVEDLVAGLVAALTTPLPAGTEFVLCGDEPVRVAELAERVVAEVGIDVPIVRGALDVARPEREELRADASRAREVLGWAPQVDLQEGIRRTVAWYREQSGRAEE